MAAFFTRRGTRQEIATLQEKVHEQDKTIQELEERLKSAKEESVRM